MVDDFIARKHGRAAGTIDYLHPSLAEILKPTYGVILYQEQVMQIAQTLSGYTLGGADLLRRAMGKKKPEEMAKHRAIFREGAAKNGLDEAKADEIFDLMEKFAGYGFNKSHAAAYALVAYQTAYFKAHHAAAFMISTASGVPATTASTLPSARFRTQPLMPNSRAVAATNCRKPTPCTRPVAIKWRLVSIDSSLRGSLHKTLEYNAIRLDSSKIY